MVQPTYQPRGPVTLLLLALAIFATGCDENSSGYIPPYNQFGRFGTFSPYGSNGPYGSYVPGGSPYSGSPYGGYGRYPGSDLDFGRLSRGLPRAPGSTPSGGVTPSARNVPAYGTYEQRAEAAMFDILNQVRQQNNLGPFQRDSGLDTVARKHSREMSELNYFDHDSPVPQNRSLTQRYDNDRIQYSFAAENIFMMTTGSSPEEQAREMVDGYMNSPGHRRNILNPSARRIGIGNYNDASTSYNTQNFAD